MATFNLFTTGLFLHIIGIALISGGTLGHYITLRKLWGYLPGENQKATVVFKISSTYDWFLRIGGVVLILSGFMLLRAYQFGVTKQFWFEFKMGLIVLMMLNIILIGAPGIKKLQALLVADNSVTDMLQYGALRKRIRIFHIGQFLILLLIFMMGVFKFQ